MSLHNIFVKAAFVAAVVSAAELETGAGRGERLYT